jgi:Bacterial protein of unknown function (HtrL_YibB)
MKVDIPKLVFIGMTTALGLLVFVSLPLVSKLALESDHSESLGKIMESKRLRSVGRLSQSPMVAVQGDDTQRPSAKTLLTMQPPFEDSQAIRLSNNLIKSPNTVVTGYFRVPSKYKPGKYDGWMRNMLSLQDAMVIFTQKDMIDQVKDFRGHAKNRTVIIPLEIDQLPYATLYSKEFWQGQLEKDPEKKRHRSYELFWIWLSKSWLTTQAIRMNWFDSDLFVWSDIGCFRDEGYNSKTMIQHREVVPTTEMIQMAHHPPNPPPEELFNDKYHRKANFYHSGSQLAGYKETWLKFHEYFLDIIDRFLNKNMIIVEDQAVLQSTCLSHPEICAYLPFTQVNDNHYFGLRYALHHGGNYTLWRHKPR